MRKVLAFIDSAPPAFIALVCTLMLLLATIGAHAADKPLVLDGSPPQLKVLPANTAVQTNASSTSAASINLPHGTAPSSPNNGDCWTTTAGLFCYINGSTVGPYSAGSSLSPANPTATCGTAAVNGSASTYMRSDAAPACPAGTNATKGLVEGDGTTITCVAGVCSLASVSSAALDALLGSTRGSVAERGASGWTIVVPSSTAGWALTSNGTGADPTYQAPTGSLPGYGSAAVAAVFMNNFGGL